MGFSVQERWGIYRESPAEGYRDDEEPEASRFQGKAKRFVPSGEEKAEGGI